MRNELACRMRVERWIGIAHADYAALVIDDATPPGRRLDPRFRGDAARQAASSKGPFKSKSNRLSPAPGWCKSRCESSSTKILRRRILLPVA